MNKIALASSKKKLTNWRKRNKKYYKVVFYGSPRKDKKGAYALISDYRKKRIVNRKKKYTGHIC